MMHRNLWLAGVGTAAGFALARWQFARWFVEEPPFHVERRIGAIEIRRYPRTVRAETTLEATSFEAALNTGFQRLARYIFGANKERRTSADLDALAARSAAPSSGDRGSKQIPMTAPVGVRAELQALEPADDPRALQAQSQSRKSFTIMFTLPREHGAAPFPIPVDSRVRLRSVPPRRVAVLRYSGRHSARRVAEKSRQLLEAVRAAGLETRGEPEFAGYDPPTTLPWLRRNEVWVELGHSNAS
jgi:hypothetical protein